VVAADSVREHKDRNPPDEKRKRERERKNSHHVSINKKNKAVYIAQ